MICAYVMPYVLKDLLRGAAWLSSCPGRNPIEVLKELSSGGDVGHDFRCT